MSTRALLLVLSLGWPLQPLDDAARGWVLSLRQPALDVAMRQVSDRSPIVLPAALVLSLAGGTVGRVFFAEAALALIPLNLAVETLKWTVNRTRPDGDRNRRNSSFPSSHAGNAFTLAAVLTRRWRRWAVPAWLAASVVAFSRMYLDRHWLSDVCGSAVLALAATWFATWAARRWRERRGALRTS
jgi:membrane-associated phospholipid phosphatase